MGWAATHETTETTRSSPAGATWRETCRRAVTIVAAAFVFRNAISLPSAAGILLIIGGSASYAVASARARAEGGGGADAAAELCGAGGDAEPAERSLLEEEGVGPRSDSSNET